MSAFQRERSAAPQLPGTRPSLQNGQLRVSTGNAAIDAIFGGGLPLGAIWLLEEDRYAVYSRALQRYFLGEAALHGHAMLLANLEEDPREFLTKIPQPCPDQSTPSASASRQPPPSSTIIGQQQQPPPEDDLRIAWRYNSLPKVDAEQRTSISAPNFDLSTSLRADQLSALDATHFGPLSALADASGDDEEYSIAAHFANPHYARLLLTIRRRLANLGPANVLRICLTGLGGPLWYAATISADLVRFLRLLRALLRPTAAVCCLSMPAHLLHAHDERLVVRIRNCVDYSLQLESFAGSERETNPIFAEYHGLLWIRRQVALNTLAAAQPATHDLAFKLRRRAFVVERLHLPPELQEEGGGEGAATMTCSSSGGGGGGAAGLLDF